MNRTAWAWLLALGAALGRPAGAAEAWTEQVWHTDHGLPQHTVQALAQTRDGYLWIGTRFGLARFDGVRFRNWGPATDPAFGDGSVSALAEGPDGTLWIGTYAGLLALRGGAVARVEAVPAERIWALHAAADGRLWLGLAGGLATWDGRTFAPRPLAGPEGGDFQTRSIAADADGALIVAGQGGVLRVDPATGRAAPWLPPAATVAQADAQPDAASPAAWHFEPVAGGLADGGAGLFREGSGRGRNSWGARLAADPEGGWWVVDARRRLFHFDPAGSVRRLVARDPRVAEALCVFRDREGSLWVGTAVGGLVRLRPAVFETHTLGAGEEGPCFTVVADGVGAVWAANLNCLFGFHADGVERHELFTPAEPSRIMTVLPAAGGGLWLGRDREGVFRWRDGRLHPVEYAGTTRHRRIRALLETRDRALWIGSRGGLTRWQDGAARHYDEADGLARADVGALHEAADGALWAGLDGGGAARLEGGRFRSFGPADGLAGDTVWGFAEEADGTLWLHGRGGLTRWRAGRFARVTPAHGLFDELNNQMLPDGAGHYWLGCNRGLYRVRADELHAVADGRTNRLTAVHYGASDGLLVAETNGENQPAGAVTPDGALWFPTPAGVVRADPARLPRNEVPPRPVIEAVRSAAGTVLDEAGVAAGFRARVDGGPRLPPGAGRVVEFDYTAASLAAPERVQFRHRLAGHDGDWVEAGPRRVAFYTNLRPGRYVFEVLAANHHGVWAAAPARFAFSVAPAWHQTAWFPPAVAALLAGAALGAHRLRVRLVRRRLALESALRLARERERIARDMHDDVGASLTQIALLAERARRPGGPEAGPLLGRIAEAARDAARAMDEIVWAVNPHNDRLEPLAAYLCQYAREYLEPAGVRCRLDVPPLLPDRPVPSAMRHHLLFVLKEALGNVVRHAAAAEVTVRFGLEDGELVLAVTDDGRGFNPAAAPAARPGGGNGLANLSRRLKALDGRLVLRSAPGAGTTVEARVGQAAERPGGNSKPQAPSSEAAAGASRQGRVRPHD